MSNEFWYGTVGTAVLGAIGAVLRYAWNTYTKVRDQRDNLLKKEEDTRTKRMEECINSVQHLQKTINIFEGKMADFKDLFGRVRRVERGIGSIMRGNLKDDVLKELAKLPIEDQEV